MIQKEKELLLRDLCSRLPYNPLVEYEGEDYNVLGIAHGRLVLCKPLMSHTLNENPRIEEIKPYLFPLSSMTEEQAMELFKLFGISLVDSDYIKINECTGITFFLNKGFDVETHLDKLIDWLNKNHFDWRGLIPMGLAIDATGLNIY
jgi:hypothetical protein